MKIFKSLLPLLISVVVIYVMGFLHEVDFGFGEKNNIVIAETLHFIVFGVYGFLLSWAMCVDKIRRPCAIVYIFGLMFFTAIIGEFYEVKVHPHEGNLRDLAMHIISGILGMIIWRIARKNEI